MTTLHTVGASETNTPWRVCQQNASKLLHRECTLTPPLYTRPSPAHHTLAVVSPIPLLRYLHVRAAHAVAPLFFLMLNTRTASHVRQHIILVAQQLANCADGKAITQSYLSVLNTTVLAWQPWSALHTYGDHVFETLMLLGTRTLS